MSKKQLVKDNLLVFAGANIASMLNLLLNILLGRTDDRLFNLYTTYNSISLILLIPSLVSMRIFTVFGESTLVNIKEFYLNNKTKVLNLLIVSALLLVPVNFILTKITVEGTYVTSFLLIILSIIGFLANIFRGIKQNNEEYLSSVASINLEAIGRVILGFMFAIYLNMGISGILLGHILGLVFSLITCYDNKFIHAKFDIKNELKLRNLFINTLLITTALEFISNFDIIYSNNILNSNLVAQTEFNTLQFFRKVIFFGTFGVSSVVLSMGGKDKHSKKFAFFFTLSLGIIIGLGMGGFFFTFRNIVLSFLDKSFTSVTIQQQLIFLLSTLLMSTAYLLSNWLFTLKKKIYIYLPIFAGFLQTIIFVSYGVDLETLLKAYLISSLIFFILTFTGGVIESRNPGIIAVK